MRRLIEGMGKTLSEGFVSSMEIQVSKGLLDFIWHPMDGFVEVGLGGEWWNGNLPKREGEVAQFHHKKEGGDPSYRPVKISWEREGNGVRFFIHGGFLSEVAEVRVGVTKAVSE